MTPDFVYIKPDGQDRSVWIYTHGDGFIGFSCDDPDPEEPQHVFLVTDDKDSLTALRDLLTRCIEDI